MTPTRQTAATNDGHHFDIAAYCARVGYSGDLAVSADMLRALQAAHIAAIPFEAIDVLVGDGVSLDPAVIEDKLVHRRRGGYCYEQNGLFSRALEYIGFAVEPRIARVLWGGVGDDQFQPRTHMVLLVEAAGEQWLVDVGFGSAVPTAPLRWTSEIAQDTRLGQYRLMPTSFGRRLELETDGGWRALYEVLLEVPQREDFEVSNWFTSTHPQSPFRRNLIVARATRDERIILSGSELTFRSVGHDTRKEKLDLAGLEIALREFFGLSVEPRWRSTLAQLVLRS
ncbi:arylamine N-acetyltransferase [Sphingomonas sp.]|uniref:arylamine N-acetyltransferase family protein n=1 Tax=Sphingomonas sp. TaxID=28214 RepID=UPI002ED99F90